MSNAKHAWRFFRAGGFDQVYLDRGDDLACLAELDQKLWVALACPTTGLEFDKKTLDLIDTDKDGRIRAPEIIAATQWACAMLKDPVSLVAHSASLPVDAINTASPEGQQLQASARQILTNLGKADATEISVDDTADTVKIFALTKFNGDGVVPADAADDPAVQAVINDIVACLGGDPDRSGKLGITQAKLDLFFASCEAFVGWQARTEADKSLLPLGANTAAASAAIKAVAPKIDDYFARCRLTSFDPRATAAVNRAEAEYVAVAAKELSLAGTELAAFPLARVEAGRPLPLTEGVNPGWRAAIASFSAEVVKPILGEKTSLTEAEWAQLVAKFASFDGWLSAKAGGNVEKLGLERVRQVLASPAKAAITELLAKDKALEPQANAIAAVDRLVRYHRDLHVLLNNFVSFRDFYGRRDKAVFQAGTLYLDQRSCDLCVRVEDAGRHGLMAHLSRSYLAYCDLVRKATGEKMAIVAAFTAGDSDNLMVGRNGIFYDRQGRDWDATITKIVENPISIRQAFMSPYKRTIRWVEDMIAKRAAAADSAANDRLQAAAAAGGTAATTGKPPEAKPKIDIGVVAALGVAVGGITAALGMLLQAFFGLGIWMPIGLVGLVVLISGPSMVIAWLKLRQRNLGPILDANGWAVNAKAKINIPFGRSLTAARALPPGSKRDLRDPYAESHKARNRILLVALLLFILGNCWYFGCFQKYLPEWLPKSSHVQRREALQAVDEELRSVQDDLDRKLVEAARATLDRATAKLAEVKDAPSAYAARVKEATKQVTAMEAAKAASKAPASQP